MKRIFKRSLALILSMLVIVGVIAPTVSAFSIEYYGNADMWLVDANTHYTASTIYLYGRADYLCLKLKKDSEKAAFYFEMYSDADCKNKVASYSTESTSGTKYVTLSMSFDGLKSGTYYAKTYVYKETNIYEFGRRRLSVDPATKRSYKVQINKKGTSVKDMNTVMYGFENTEKGPIIYWYSVPGATGYYVYRKNPNTGKYENIGKASDSGGKTSCYLDKSFKGITTKRNYKVVAYNNNSKTPQSLLPMTAKIYKTPVVKVEAIESNKVKISWSKISSEAMYTVYISTDKTNWDVVYTTSKCSYKLSMKEYENNKKYYFTVVAKINGIYSGYDESGVAYHYLKAPSIKDCTFSEEGGITVNWRKVEGADGYKIYRSTSSEGVWEDLADVGDVSSFTDKKVVLGEMYHYRVRSVRKGVLGSYLKKGKAGVILAQPELQDAVELENDTVRISWSDQNKNCKYRVYDKVSGSWERIGTTKYNNMDYELPYEVSTHIFTVRPYIDSFVGSFDKIGVSYQAFPKVRVTGNYVDANGYNLIWEKPKGAGDSVIYRKTEDSEYELLAQTSDCFYCDVTAEASVSYTYKITYIYDNEIVEKAADETRVLFIDDVVGIVDKQYEVYLDMHRGGYYGYNIAIENFNSKSTYVLYERVDGKWLATTTYSAKKGTIFVDLEKYDREIAIVEIKEDGTESRLPEKGLTLKYTTPPFGMTLEFVENDATITWPTENLNCDNVVIYRNSEIIATIPASEGKYIDENLERGTLYIYSLRGESGGFISESYPYADKSHNHMKTPEIKISAVGNGLEIKWSEIYKAQKYIVYRKSSTQKSWEKIAVLNGYKRSYVDTNVNELEEYTYTVKAKYNDYYSPYNKQGVTYHYITSPEYTLKNTAKGVEVSIEKKQGVDGYIIKAYSNGKWRTLVKIDDPSKTTYLDTDVHSGQAKSYLVRAYVGASNGDGRKKSSHYFLDQPKITSLTKTDNGVKIKYDKVEGAVGYYVYRKAAGSTGWTKITTTKSVEFLDKNVKSGVKYTYTVKAYCKGKTIESAYNKTGWSITYKK